MQENLEKVFFHKTPKTTHNQLKFAQTELKGKEHLTFRGLFLLQKSPYTF